MKLLMFQASRFEFRACEATAAADRSAAETDVRSVDDAAVIFIHAEPGDVERLGSLVGKAAKNVKWIANKRASRAVVLHSFGHLADEKAPAEFAATFITALSERLSGNGYRVESTPFGWSCEWTMAVHGEPIAKVFKSL